MKSKKTVKSVLSLFVCFAMATAMLAGCAGKTAKSSSSSSSTPNSTSSASTKPLTITVFDDAANFQGKQTGWFGNLIQKKFNLTFNLLAPNVAGTSLYQTRAAAGNLGDLLIIDNNELSDCIKAGLVKDMSDSIKNYPNLMKYYDEFSYFNKTFDKQVNPTGKIYGLPTNTTPTSPTTFTAVAPYSSPMLPWNYYSGIGSPKIANLNGLMDVLQQMLKKYPTSPTGKKTIGITLWKDWDNYIMENVRWLCNWYGWEEPNDTSTVLMNADGQAQDVTDDNGMYHQILQFYFDANQKGLVDPDSASQDWNAVNTKLTNEQVMLCWYSWQIGFFNTIPRGQQGQGVTQVPIGDTHLIQEGDPYYGDGRLYAIGSKASDPARIMQFLDWFVSPEGMRYNIDGIEGFNYEKQSNGKFALTTTGQTAFQNNTPVPAEYGGGGYQDGQCKLNIDLIGTPAKDPDTGEPYDNNLWSSYIQANQTTMTKAWMKLYNADNSLDYYKKNNMISVVPNINVNLGNDSSTIKNERNQCKKILLDTSWSMIFAKNQADFDKLWSNMKTQLNGMGWGDLLSTDQARVATLASMRKQVETK